MILQALVKRTDNSYKLALIVDGKFIDATENQTLSDVIDGLITVYDENQTPFIITIQPNGGEEQKK